MAQLTRLRSALVRSRYLFLLATICFGCFITLSITNGRDIWLLDNDLKIRKRLSRLELHHYEIQPEERYTIKTEGCTIPGLIPLDDAVKSFKKPPTRLKSCPNANYTLLLRNETHIWIDMEMLSYYNVSMNKGHFSCCYKAFYRPFAVKNVLSKFVDNRAQYLDCLNFTNQIKVAHEFVQVTCFFREKLVYKDYFLFARKTSKTDESNKDNPYYNVIVMGIDAISRLNFYRTMPKTLNFLKNKGAIELLGYNKVGDNTFPNLVPMLLGLKVTDLKKTCWPTRRATFDNCPFIWQWFQEAGFHTAFGEDSAFLSTFNLGKYGFVQAPTDYYLRTFINEAEQNIGNMKDFNSYICMGNKYFYKVLLDYIEHLTTTLRSSKLFGFFWEVTMSHDYLNYPMAMDSSYETFLEKLDTSNKLNNTVLILLSDHGMRWGPIRLTKQGRLEERLPFAHLLLPPSFERDYNQAYNNLKQNSKRLTTPYDIYAMLYDLIDLHAISNKSIKRRSESSYALDRSISLFLPIPDNRTCKMADIEDHWCTCHKTVKMDPKSPMANTVAEQLVIHLNKLLENHPVCAELSLSKVIEVTEVIAGTPRRHELGWDEYMVVVKTSPGNGVFEGTMRHRWDKWSISGSISRLNLYGSQSDCIHLYQLKLYCYCR